MSPALGVDIALQQPVAGLLVVMVEAGLLGTEVDPGYSIPECRHQR